MNKLKPKKEIKDRFMHCLMCVKFPSTCKSTNKPLDRFGGCPDWEMSLHMTDKDIKRKATELYE